MKWTYCYIILLLLCICCTEDKGMKSSINGNVIILQLATVAEKATRIPGEDAFNENVVEDIQLFFYDEDGKECLFSPEDGDMQHNSGAHTVTITIPPAIAGNILDRSIIIYVVANSEVSINPEGKTLEQLQQTTYTNTNTFNTNPFTPVESFLMDGKLTKVTIPSTGTITLPILQLRRAAAKIAVTISSTNITGYEAQSAEIRFNNYLDITSLGSDVDNYIASKGEYRSSEFRPMSLPGTPVANEGPLYSYANDWEFDAMVESYITLKVNFKKTDGPEEKDYYYRIPFNYIPDNAGDKKKFCLRRNFIYEFDVKLSELGGNDPEETVELSPSFTIKDWTTEDVEIYVNPYDFLIVEERKVEMHDIMHYEIPYVSSTRVSVRMDEVYYNLYGKKGVVTKVIRELGDTYYPTVVADLTKNIITIDCKVPVNYVPNNIYFTVVAESGLEQEVEVLLYPRQYVTAEWSPGPQGSWAGSNTPEYGQPEQTNYNFYTVTTTSLASDDDFVLGDPTIRYDDGYDNPVRTTRTDEISNRIISPQFVIASQRGITVGDLFQSTAHGRCMSYYETPQKYTLGMWRVPTNAELLLIAKLQRDEQSAVKDLFYPANRDSYWWAARTGPFTGGKTVYSVKVANHPQDTDQNILRTQQHWNGAGDSAPKNSVRCVYDVWRPYEKNGQNAYHNEVYGK